MPPRQLIRGTLAAILVLLLMFGGSLLWLVTQSPLTLVWQQNPIPALVRFIPDSSAAAFILDAPLTQVQSLAQAVTAPRYRRANRQTWQRILSEQGPGLVGDLLKTGNIDFQREVAPWLGDAVLLTLTPLDELSSGPIPSNSGVETFERRIESTVESTTEPSWGTLAVLSTTDVEASNLFLNLIWQHQSMAGLPLNIETYKGVQIVSTLFQHTGSPLVGAAVGADYVMLATHPQLVKEALDTWQLPQLALTGSPRYQTIMDSLSTAKLGWVYLNLDQLDPDGLLQSFGLRLGLNFNGLTLDSVAHWGVKQDPLPRPPKPYRRDWNRPFFQRLPHTTLAVLSGQHLATDLQALQHNQLAAGSALTDRILQAEAASGLDWNQDLFSWMNHRYGLVVLEPEQPEPGCADVDWLLVANVDEQSEVAQTSLDLKATAHGWDLMPVGLSQSKWGEAVAWIPPASTLEEPESETAQPEPSDLAAQSVRIYGQPGLDDELLTQIETEVTEESEGASVLDPYVSASVFHLTYQSRFYISSSLAALEQVLSNSSKQTSKQWQMAQAKLPKSNQGYLFVNLDQGIRWLSTLDSQMSLMKTINALQAEGLSWPQTLMVTTTELDTQSGLGTYQSSSIQLDYD